MKLKRIMAMVLCVAMVLSTMSFNVFATEGTTATEASDAAVVAEVGDVEYTDLKEALEACTNGEIIKIIADITYGESDVVDAIGGATGFGDYSNPSIIYVGGTKGDTDANNQPSNVNAVIDLNGHTITNNADAYLFMIMDNAKVTFKDSSTEKTGAVISTTETPVIWTVGTETLVTIESGIYQTASGTGLLHITHGGDLVIEGGEFKTTADDASLLIMLNSHDRQNSKYFISGRATIAIKGGIFHGFNPEKVGDDNGATSIEDIKFVNGCADGFAPVENGNGTFGVVDDYVQWIKDELLAGHDVTLTRDVFVDGSYITSEPHEVNGDGKYPNYGIFTVLGDHDVTIDLNGYDVTYSGHADFEWNGKTINSCTVAHGLFFANGGADLTIVDSIGNSEITVYGLASGAYVATPDTTLTIEGGTWKNEGCETCNGTNIFLYPLQGGELYITGGYFEQALDSEGESYLIVEHGGEYANSVIDYSKTKVEISGGTFVGMNPSEIKKFNQTADNKLDMTTEPTTNGCADGFDVVMNDDGTFGVQVDSATSYVAKVGDNSYESLAIAVKEANEVEDGATIELLKDVILSEKLTITGNVTISGEHTITRAGDYTGTIFEVSADATLTLDGGLVVDGGNAWNYINVPLEMDMANGAGTYVGNHITPAENGVNATASLIKNNGTLNANRVTIENSYSTNGVSAIECGASSKTILDGTVMQNIAANRSGAVVYVGGADAVLTIMGETRITGNFGIGNGGIIQNYGQGTTVNMEGGSIDNNHIGKSGTLYASYSSNANKINTFNMSGGIITENIMEGYGPVYIHTNTVWNMTGGEISENTSFLPTYVRSKNNAGIISGGEIVNNEITGTDYNNGYYVTRPDIYLGTGSQITGGTFTQDVTEYLAPDNGLVYNEATGTYSLTQELYEYNGVAYKTFAEVIEKIKSSPATLADEDKTPVVKVRATHRPSKTIVIDTNIVMDLNGKSLLGVTGVNPIIRVLADVTITGNGMIDSANQGDGYCFIVGSSDGSEAGNLTIENGTFKGTTTAVSVTKGTATILDGDFRVKPYQVDGQDANYNFLLNCIDTNYKDGSAKIIVKGGKFTKFNPADNAAEGANTSFVAPGHMAVDNDDETWNVIGMVAMIGETGFATLAEAIKTAQANDTIKLVANVTENVTINKNITLDGANFNYTGKMNIDAKAVTVQNLNVVGGNIVKGSGTKSGANITIKNCDFDGQMANVYAVELRATNKIVIEDCTAKNYGYGFLQVPKSNNTISVKNVDISDVNYGFKIDYSNGVTLENVNVTDARQIGIYDSNYGKKVYTIKNCKITGKTPIAIWERNTTTYDTFNFVGANDLGTAEFTISNQAILKLADADTVLKACEGLNVTTDVEGHCVKYIEGAYYVLPDFTVEAIASVNGDATVETAVAGDIITVDVKVTKGGNYTNADWVLKYDPRYVTYNGTDAKNYKISGKVYDGAPNDGYDELNADYALGTYTFTVNELTKPATAVFKIVDAHVHNYAMAIDFDGVEASKQDDSVAIKFKRADREIGIKTVDYNGMEQRGNTVTNAPANATITYSETENFTNGTQLPPAFVDAGTHTYYAQIKLDGYDTKVVEGTLVIDTKDVEPSVEWMVAPESDKVEFIPVIKGIVDESYKNKGGKVTVTGQKADGSAFEFEFDASEFAYDGHGKAVYTGAATEIGGIKGDELLEVTVKYIAGTDDNYANGEETASVYVNKSTIDDVMEDKLEALIVGVGEDIVYDGQTHNVTVDVVELAKLGWTADVKAHNGIKNYGDVEVVDVTFTDTTGKYNDYTATVMIKIVRRDVTIYVNNATKKNGQPDSEATVWGYTAITSNGSGEAIIGTDLGEIKIVRANGKTDEVEGSYPITAIYTPNDNYTVKVEDGTLTIFDAVVKIEVVDNAHNGNQLKYQDVMSDYTAGSVANGNKATKMILVHTDADYAFFTYKGEKMYDVTDAEYYYVDHNYDTGIHTTDKQYRHVYAIVVDAEYGDVTTETIEGKYASHIAYAGKDATAAYAPVKVTYDADINDKSELHTNDYSTVKGVYGGIYSNSRYQISILKADYTKDKIVNTADAIAVKNIVIGE